MKIFTRKNLKIEIIIGFIIIILILLSVNYYNTMSWANTFCKDIVLSSVSSNGENNIYEDIISDRHFSYLNYTAVKQEYADNPNVIETKNSIDGFNTQHILFCGKTTYYYSYELRDKIKSDKDNANLLCGSINTPVTLYWSFGFDGFHITSIYEAP